MIDSIVVRSLEDIAPHTGPHTIPGIRFRPLRAALDVRAWGMNALDLDPGCTGYPTHDHVGDGQEEVYLVLSGEVVLEAGGERHTLRAGDLAWVPPAVTRKLVTEAQGARVLALGGTPGKAYEPAGGM